MGTKKTGKGHALSGLMTADDVAVYFNISPRRARALLRNRHERFGTGIVLAGSIIVHRDDLPIIAPVDGAEGKACTWNGVEYQSIAEAARDCGITSSSMNKRLKKGYRCDDDLLRKR